MAEISNTYQNDVGFIQGGTGMYIKETATFKFYDTDYTGAQLRNYLETQYNGELVIINSGTLVSDNGGSSPPIIQSNYGFIVFSIATGVTNGSARMFSGLAGQEVIIVTRGAGNNCSVKIFFSGAAAADALSGAQCVGTGGAFLSSIDINTSAASHAFLRLKCFTAGTWCILDKNYNTVTENVYT